MRKVGKESKVAEAKNEQECHCCESSIGSAPDTRQKKKSERKRNANIKFPETAQLSGGGKGKTLQRSTAFMHLHLHVVLPFDVDWQRSLYFDCALPKETLRDAVLCAVKQIWELRGTACHARIVVARE